MSLASEFFRIFAGLERSHGYYAIPANAKPNGEGKLHDRSWARTVPEPVTIELWDKHLEGRIGLGVVPIRDDGTCVFGAIDVDVYPLDLKALQARVMELALPLILCRTKSGGAHLYLFLSEPTPAALVRSRLQEWAVLLNHPGVEIFPKQTRLASEKDSGSWINMPYQGGRKTLRYAIHIDGTALTPEQFLEHAGNLAMSEDELDDFHPIDPTVVDDDFLRGAPPCMQTLQRIGFGNWQNNGLFNICVYLRKRYGDGWTRYVEEYNRKLLSPPVDDANVRSIIKSVSKKTYFYMCKQEPICGVCNKQVCVKREFGIGGDDGEPGVVFGELEMIETDPPTWIWDVDGARLEVNTDDIMDQKRFHKISVEKLRKLPKLVKGETWTKMIRERVERAKVTKVPEDATREGQFLMHVQRFCTSRVKGRSIDELLLHKPFTEKGRTYFVSLDLLNYLTQHKFNGINEKEMYRWIRKLGMENHFTRIKGKPTRYWSIEAFPEQTEDHDVPRIPQPEEM